MIALTLSVVFLLNTGLLSYTAYAETFEVTLDEFRDDSPEDLQEFGLVNVLVEAGLQAGGINSHLQSYCQRVQEELGVVCLITPWQGETASRMVEALQQMYFEGVEV